LTKTFATQRGVRQGDPMSPTLFIIALYPLLRAIQDNKDITPSPNPVKWPPKIVAYADDLTLTLSKTTSLTIIKSILEDFHKASGLTLNKEKTSAITTTPILNKNELWDINWRPQHIDPLNIVTGPPTAITKSWNKKIAEIKEKIKQLRLQHATFDTKAVISKTILTPIITHLANTHYLPKPKQELVNNIIAKCAVSFPNSVLNINKLTKPKKDGAYDFADVSTYACLTYVKHITLCTRAKINNEILPPHLRHFE